MKKKEEKEIKLYLKDDIINFLFYQMAKQKKKTK